MNIQIKDNQLIIKAKYDPATIEKIKPCPDGRKWDKESRAWIVDITNDNIESLKAAGFDVPEPDEIVKNMDSSIVFRAEYWDIIKNPKGVKPYYHQRIGSSIVGENNLACLFWEQGVGKTLPVVMIVQNIVKHPDKKRLIVSPKGVIGSWVTQIEKFSIINYTVIQCAGKKRKQLIESNSGAFIINYDLLTGMLEDLQAANFDMIVFDESQYIMNPTSQRSKAAYELAKGIPRRYLLTGTPIGNGSVDIFQQFKILDPSIFGTSFYAFRNKYFTNKGWSFKNKKTGKEQKVPDWKIKSGAIAEMRRKIALRAHRLTKAECLDLPKKIYQTVEVEMTPEQKTSYRQALQEIKIFINGEEYNTRQAIVKMMRLNQICSGHIGSGANTEPIRHNKLNQLRRLWEDAGQPKMVVWTPFTYDIEVMKKEFQDSYALSFYGGNTREENELFKTLFQEDEKYRIIACNERSGGVGITLTASSFVVYYSRSYSLLNRLQSEDRTHRIGQNMPVTYIDLVCANSIEKEILLILECKRKVSRELLGDDERRSLAKEIIGRLK